MIQSVQSSESVANVLKSNFKGTEAGAKKSKPASSSQLTAAEYKYGLACLWAASAQLENAKLKQELANASAQANYCKACCQ